MLSKAKFYSIVERIQQQHGDDDTTVLGYIFLNCTAPKSHTIALPWLVHTCSSGTLCRDDLSGGEALIQFCQQKNSHSRVHDWLTDHHVSIWSTESSQVKPSTSVLVLNGKSLLVTSMASDTLTLQTASKGHKRSRATEEQYEVDILFNEVGLECLNHGATVLLFQAMKCTVLCYFFRVSIRKYTQKKKTYSWTLSIKKN